MVQDNRARLKQWLESGEARLQPLAFPQRELWETSPVPVGDPANHICGFIEIKGPITPPECERAIQRVIERQEALRISFLPGKERSVQMIRATGSPQLRCREVSSAEAQPEALEEIMKETFREPFDLMQGPLHRVEMIRRGTNDHVLAFSIHHAIADGWSLGVFVQDLCTAYVMGLTGFRKAMAVGVMGMNNALPPVAQTYTEWAAAERAIWEPAELARHAGFWRSRLEGARRLCGRNDGPRPVPGPLERWVSAVPADLARGVRELTRRTGTTLFSTLLAAFQATLSKWTGEDDILVGTPVANRTREAIRQTMGYVAGVVPLRLQVDRSESFAVRMRGVHEAAMDSFAHALPFAELAALVGEPQSPGDYSIFDVRFALQNHPVPDVVLPRISTRLRMRSTGTARFGLGCEITEVGSELEVVWLFQPLTFSAAEIAEMHRLLLAVLVDGCHNPESRAAALSV